MKHDRSPSSTRFQEMGASAAEAAALMKSLSNRRRLLILCHLMDAGEMSVGELVRKVGGGQSALSQHLAKLREQGLVSFRREAQTLYYRVSDDRAATLIGSLHQMFCVAPHGELGKSPMAVGVAVPEKSGHGG